MKEKIELIRKMNLDYYLNFILKHSNSNDAPYHNFSHLLTVAQNAYFIAIYENLEEESIRLLLIAALFHDTNHSKGEYLDNINIENSIGFFNRASKESTNDYNKIVSIIKATEYPYKISENLLNKEQLIIRDADIICCFENSFIQDILIGLGSETKTPIDDMIKNQLKFLENLNCRSDYAIKKVKKFLPKVKKEMLYLQKILNQ